MLQRFSPAKCHRSGRYGLERRATRSHTVRTYLLCCFVLSTFLLSACAVEFPLISAPSTALAQQLDATADPAVAAFTSELVNALVERDFTQLQAMMANPFLITWLDNQTVTQPAAVALLSMRDRYLSPKSTMVLREVDRLSGLLDEVALPMQPDSDAIVQAIYLVGLGDTQNDEALLLIARDADDRPYWHGVLLADGGFPHVQSSATQAMPTTNAVEQGEIVASPSDPQFLLELRNIDGDEIGTSSMLPQVQFAVDDQRATIRGVIQPTQERSYLLHPHATTPLHFALQSANPSVNFAIVGVDDGITYKGLEENMMQWQGELSTVQPYLVTISATVAQPFELAITLAADRSVAATTAPVAAAETP